MKYDIEIDKDNLDEESLYVPAAFDAFQMEEAKASERWDTLKDKMRVVQADISLEIRGWKIEKINSFFQLDLPKLTEAVYGSLVIIHPVVIDLMNKIAEARRDTLIFQAARKAIENKAAGLDRLAKLHGQGYFMKIEGRAYNKVGLDAVLERVKESVIRRLKDEENANQPPVLAGKTAKSGAKTLKVPKPPADESDQSEGAIERLK